MRWNYGLMLATLTVNPSHLPGEVSPLLRKTYRAVYARKALVQLKIMVISSVLSFSSFMFLPLVQVQWWSCVLSFSSLIFLADDQLYTHSFCLFVFKSTCSRTMSEPSTAWLPALGCVKILRTPTTRLQRRKIWLWPSVVVFWVFFRFTSGC